VQFDLSAYPLVVNELESISRYLDMGTGVQRDTIQGLLGGDRQTAREFLGRMEQARTRLGLESKLFERMVIEGLADDFRTMNRQWLPFPKMVSLIGSAALTDPDTGAPIPPDQQPVDLNDINAGHRIRAVGASNMLAKSMQQQNMITALQAMQSNPMAMQITNWTGFFTKFWRAFEFDPHEMMNSNSNPNAAAILQNLTSGGQGGGGAPQGDVLAALAQTQGNANALGMSGPRSTLAPMSGIGAGLQQNIGQ
jgi:hypothetical protein